VNLFLIFLVHGTRVKFDASKNVFVAAEKSPHSLVKRRM